MINFIYSQILFYLAIAIVLFIPGYFLLLAIFGKSKVLTALESFVISFGLSIIIVDILLILLDRFGVIFNASSILISIFVFIIICYTIFLIRKKSEENEQKNFILLDYSKKQASLIILIIVFSILIRAIFLFGTITPTGTDLGHHMFWTKKIIETGKIPTYEKTDIIEKDGAYSISEPAKIDDFIIGEHLIFASIGLISKNNVVSAFPSLVLFLINIMGILAIFILSERLFSFLPYGKNISITALFLLGSLFALSGSQGNFISGGVIGNLIGNLFIPLIFYFFLRAVQEKNALLFFLGIFGAFGLAYTHHLSTFLFVFSLASSIFLILIFSGKEIFLEIKKWLALIFSPLALSVIFLSLLFLFFVKIPGYVENQAVKTIIGEPTRATKAGLSLEQIFSVAGESRTAIGIAGVIIFLLFVRKRKYQSAIILGWFFSIFILSWKPTLFNIDIPSARIGNYLIYPLILSGAFALNWILFECLFDKKNNKYYINKNLSAIIFIILLLYVSTSGFFSEARSIQAKSPNSKFIETFAVSRYLAEHTEKSDVILKDHNYVSADSWMKVFLMRDYNYPFTRGFFFRYDAKNKEQCTLWMISEPKSSRSQKCFTETGINFVVVNPAYDSSQFNDSEHFWKIYSSNLIETYYKK
ncbi:MAG TPA: DUF1616 domain-containing protein [Candidatus Moranbacteria bacterium]|nr:DUF1616 domain-containing protein [Candidatus Moranbacteria bacterium]